MHFFDGKPTTEHPDPIMNMGHQSYHLKTPRRTLKRTSLQSVPSTSKKVKDVTSRSSNISEIETNISSDFRDLEDIPISDIIKEFDHSYYIKDSSKIRDNVQNKKHICECDGDACSCCIGCMEKSVLIQLLKDKIEQLENKIQKDKSKKSKSMAKVNMCVTKND